MGWQDAPTMEREPATGWRSAPAMPTDDSASVNAIRQHFAQFAPRAAESFKDYLTAGWQQSVTGLTGRQKAPEVALDENTPWYGRLASSLSGIVGDLPAMIPGAMAGGAAGGAMGSAVPVLGTAAGTLMGAWGGASALPAGLRAAMMEMYTKGEVQSSSDFVARALHVAWETAKAGTVGAATGGAGIAAKAALPIAGSAVAAEIATMATVGKALEGQLPEPQDFLDAGLMIGGIKAASVVAGRLRRVYEKTGKPPLEVLAESNKDQLLKAELIDGPLEKVAGPLDITPAPGLSAEHRAIETNFSRQIQGDLEGTIAAYKAIPETLGGKIINSDIIRELSPEYNASKETKALHASAVHEPASALANELFKRALKEPSATGMDLVTFTAGGSGTGKSGTIEGTNAAKTITDASDIVYDVNMATLKGAQNKIDMALDAGKRVAIIYVGRDPIETMRGVIEYAHNKGRTVPLEVMEKTHAEAGKVIDELQRIYAQNDKVGFTFIDNTEGLARPAGPEVTSRFDHANLGVRLRAVVDAEYQAGRINDAAYEGFTGDAPPGARPRPGKAGSDVAAAEHARAQGAGAVGVRERGGIEAELYERDLPTAYQPLAREELARAIVPGDEAVTIATNYPFAEIQQVKGAPKPFHVNYNYIDSSDKAKIALSALSEAYTAKIQEQRRGTVSNEKTSNEAAKMISDTLGGIDTKLLMPREPGTAAGAAEVLARKQMTEGSAEAMTIAGDELLTKGANATPEDKLHFLAAIERPAIILSEFLGARAEVGRAMQILQFTAKDAERIKMINDVIKMYGGKDPMVLAAMLKKIDTAAGALKFADLVTKASTWEKVVEAWKAGILSGPVTHMANMIGNEAFMWLRVPIDAVAAGIGAARGGEDRVMPVQPVFRAVGILQGTMDAFRAFGAVLLTGGLEGEEVGSKSEQFRKAIGGVKGEVVRLPFRLLSAEDAFGTVRNERGEAYSEAAAQAYKEGLNPLTREFRERVVSIVQNPTEAMSKAIEDAGKRFTFNTETGPIGQAVQDLVRAGHLQMIVPFIRTPGNIAKELARMTPLAPLVKEWRDAIRKGGAEKDRAMAEVAVGTSIMAVVFMQALNGNITGAGDPDKGKRNIKQAAGEQPYSVKVGDTYYNIQRLQPLGTLVGLAADVAAVWDKMDSEESDKVPKMLAVAFGNAVTNQTFLQGITNLINAMSDPDRFGPSLVRQFAASAVPNIVGQPTQMYDPVVREVNSVLEAVKGRIPGLRQELLPKRDPYGEPIQTKERLGFMSPVTETKVPDDKVRTEAARLGVSVADTPKKTHIGRGSGKLGDVKLEPEERDRFAEVGGKLAHEVLVDMVNAPGWDDLPDLVKTRAFRKVFAAAHKAGAYEALPPEKRDALIGEITEKVQAALTPE
jgi:hypothetical protein